MGEEGLIGRVITGQGTAVGHGHGGAFLGPADLQHHHGAVVLRLAAGAGMMAPVAAFVLEKTEGDDAEAVDELAFFDR